MSIKSRLATKSFRQATGGFTLIEVIVILAVVSILVAILTPTVVKYIADAQQSKAESDVKALSAALSDIIKDTGKYPGTKLFTNTHLVTDGTLLAGTGWTDDPLVTVNLSFHLLINDPNEDGPDNPPNDYSTGGRKRWKGPYLQALDEDPWGNAYQVNATTLVGGNTTSTWVISAGVDGIIQTSSAAVVLAGDDVGVRIK